MRQNRQERIPLRALWSVRYQAYRTRYRPLKALWRAVVLGELARRGPVQQWARHTIYEDEGALLPLLVKVELVGVEFHLEERR